MISEEFPDYTYTPVASSRRLFGYAPAKMNGVPIVSIITPYFNTGDIFSETLASVLGQSFQEFELIVIDDGSTDTDATAQLQELAAQDPRIRVIRQVNAGPAAARNRGFSQSCGRYICLLDSDDLLEPTFIEKCLWFLESNPNFGFCNTWSVNFGHQEFLWKVGFERGSAHLQANSGPNMSVIRREAFAASGGFDESIRLGHEDWDFWLALAKVGYWGYTIPEYQVWYRKRTNGRFHQVMNAQNAHQDSQSLISKKYKDLYKVFPSPTIQHPSPYEQVPLDIPFVNALKKPKQGNRVLYLLPWMVTGGADRVNLDWIATLTDHGDQVTICATLQTNHNWGAEFAKITSDIFILPHFLRTADYPRFLRYLITSRMIDTVVVTGSTLGYQLLPYLRAYCPAVTFVDLSHAEEPHWMNGGHPRFGVGYQDMLDLNLVTTGHLRDWMVARGADRARISVCYTGIDIEAISTYTQGRMAARATLGLDAGLPTIIFAGRLCGQKRPDFLARILAALAERGIRFKALIVGDGELRPMFEQHLNDFKLGASVQMLGSLTHSQWLKTLAAADVFLLPSAYEGISVALLEAMAMGVVPVTAAVGGQTELVTPECGVLVDTGTNELQTYVDALVALLSDTSLRNFKSESGRQRLASMFSRHTTNNIFLNTLETARALSQNQPRNPVSKGFAQEVATLAIEYTRLGKVADQLWAHQGATQSSQPHWPADIPLSGLVRLLLALGRTRMGNWVLRSRKLRALGQWLHARLEARS